MVRGASMPRNPEMRIRLTATTTGLPLPLTGDRDQPLEELAFIKGLHLGALLNGTKNRGVMPARRAAPEPCLDETGRIVQLAPLSQEPKPPRLVNTTLSGGRLGPRET